MIEAFKIGAALDLTGNASVKMKEFIVITKRATEALEVLNKRLRPLNDQFEVLNSRLLKLNPRMDKAKLSFSEMKNSMTPLNNSFTGLNSRLDRSLSKMEKLSVRTEILKNKLASLALSSTAAKDSMEGMGAASIGSGVYGRGRRREHNIASEAYHAGHGIAGIGTGASLGVGARMLGAGGLVGAGIAYVGAAGYKEEKLYQKTLGQFKQQGFSDSENKQADLISRNSHIPGISARHYAEGLTDAAMATKNFDMAKFLTPALVNISFANKANFGDFSRLQEQNLIRFAEIRGGGDPKAIMAALELGQKLYTSTGGRLKPQELLNFQKTGQTAAYHITDQGAFKLEPTMQEIGGFRTGTALQTLFNQLMTGKGMSTAESRDLSRLGILKPDSVEYDPLKRRLVNKPGALRDDLSKLLQEDPTEFGKKIREIYKEHGITNERDIIKKFAYDFGRLPAMLLANFTKNQEKIDRAGQMNPKAYGIQASKTLALSNSAGKELRLKASYENFKLAVGDLDTPYINKAMDNLADIFDKITGFVRRINGMKLDPSDNGNLAGGNVPTLSSIFNYLKNGASTIANKTTNALSIKNNDQTIQVNSTVNLDGSVVGHAVTKHQTSSFSRPPTSSTQFNPYSMTGLSYGNYQGAAN